MAKIWTIYGGKQHGLWGDLPWPRCIVVFELDEICRTEPRPKFDGGGESAPFPDHIVIQVEETEARQHGIQPGFFASPLDGIASKIALDAERETSV